MTELFKKELSELSINVANLIQGEEGHISLLAGYTIDLGEGLSNYLGYGTSSIPLVGALDSTSFLIEGSVTTRQVNVTTNNSGNAGLSIECVASKSANKIILVINGNMTHRSALDGGLFQFVLGKNHAYLRVLGDIPFPGHKFFLLPATVFYTHNKYNG